MDKLLPESDFPYSNREIREKWDDIGNALSKLSTDMSIGFTEVKGKQDQTNGNVKTLQLWRAGLTGATGVLTLIMVPLLGWALYTLSTINDRINKGVADALSAYEITVQK